MRAAHSVLFWLAFAACSAARADGGPFGIDHRINYDDSGVWKRHNQIRLEATAALIIVGGALWEGDASRLGHADWQALDSVLIGAASSEVLKHVFSRSRPTQTDDPNQWFKGHGHHSFPSTEVTVAASAMTPLVLEYGAQYPAVYALELLPAVIAVGRVKRQGHWQSDVLAGFALGTGAGYYAHARRSSLSVGLLPGGVTVGWHKRF